MGAGLMVYLVPEWETTTVVGCRDDSLLADILEQMAEDVQMLDDEFLTADAEYGPGLTFTQAMEELFTGQFSRPEHCAFMYVYAFETVCRYYGDWLGNQYFCPCRHVWFEQLDDVLARGRVPLRFQELLYRLPAALPDPRGDPCLGHWPELEMRIALPRLDALLSSLTGDEHKALGSVREWLVQAAAKPESIIVGVYC